MRPPVDENDAKRILAMKAEGTSVRAIAAALDLSKSAVQRVLRPVPTQNFGAGHSRLRHNRETKTALAKGSSILEEDAEKGFTPHGLLFCAIGEGSRERYRQACWVAGLAQENPERYRDLWDRMIKTRRVRPCYVEARERWEEDLLVKLAEKIRNGWTP